jgi:hypothetical protein
LSFSTSEYHQARIVSTQPVLVSRHIKYLVYERTKKKAAGFSVVSPAAASEVTQRRVYEPAPLRVIARGQRLFSQNQADSPKKPGVSRKSTEIVKVMQEGQLS